MVEMSKSQKKLYANVETSNQIPVGGVSDIVWDFKLTYE